MISQLDAIDLKILSELQQNGRISNNDLAARIGLSPPPCLRRVRALVAGGYVKRVRALLDEKLLGFDVTSFVEVRLDSQKSASLASFEKTMQGLSYVQECWRISGGVDYLLKCIAPTIADFQSQIECFSSLPNVQNVKSYPTLWSAKDVGVPLDVVVRRPGSAPQHHLHVRA